ncbi:sigma-54-dependent Fis family transcriptional regulator [Azorhizobium oxalatiphilum]|uniref:Sigma-54-dependent Fis family transcriptional regulator n=1 Tax=Azorhizobium oxalatiphilum TaxID=980631 RepID=A0A917BZ38_9HYPH|nr:sigma-54-dependent Fis family transcriptional regulator [Azorhizobium oxalatiphilum]GGF62770.1 sigma-54-dependent Fis family transcriptional regulator [Azorhizobium oxalatiphilum]
MEQHAIRAAWEQFLADGTGPDGISRPVAASWERSRARGVGVGLTEAPLAEEPEIFRRRSVNVALLAAARPALERSGLFLAEASSMMILSDASGFIIETAGDPRVVDHGRRNHLEAGGFWDEGAVGTNAIGTALVEGRPTQIRGAEHFCEDVQRWTCAATPIRHPLDSTLLGVVDISGPARHFNPQSLALAVAIGQEIEAGLHRAAKIEHELLLRNFVSKRSIWLSEEILVVDRRGVLVHAAESARRRVDAPPDQRARDLRRIVGAAQQEHWEEACRERFPNASVEVVRSDGEAIGCLIVMHRSRSRQPSPQPTTSGAISREPDIRFEDIRGDSTPMRDVRERARRLAQNSLPILIEGETGVGKELFARAIKAASPVASGPFVPLNCGGMPRDLIASELFGYAKGAFTGADESGRSGRIEQADGGVLCLDEIGEMPLDLQSYLLRVLEDGVVYRVGDHVGRRVNIRILSMTNRDLSSEVEAGRFRRDLYYRIAAARIRIPPLRERGEDVALLAQRFAETAAAREGRPAPIFAPGVLERLRRYAWPGNVRELRNVIDAMIALSDMNVIQLEDLPLELGALAPEEAQSVPIAVVALPAAALSPQTDLRAAERATILAQVEACGGNLTEAARRLGIARSTLYLRLADYRATSGGSH